MSDSYTLIDGFTGPEDIVLMPDQAHLLVSELPADFTHPTGPALMLVDLSSDLARPMTIHLRPEKGWGDPDYEPPPRFGTHGLHVSQRADGRTQLLAVNHAGRESIEMFELVDGTDGYSALWRGGVAFEGGMLNDVVATPDGGFISTVMLDHALVGEQDAMTFMFSGARTGYLTEWHPQAGWRRLPGSQASLNNGIQISTDGRFVWFAAWTSREVLEYDREARRITRTAHLPFHADNLTVGVDGALIVAGIDDLDDWRARTEATGALCQDKLAFSVARLDPVTFTMEPLFRGGAGLLKGGASVALAVGRALYIGSYTGEHVLKVDIDAIRSV
ncbi:hypothetical protein DM992_41195 (plasmid) [Burkholderia sp. JP2-270]|uniref:SMP-30/gluconolactonase/LRE family protein n=1 Tax=Burkholderia sp. JP2-270 TaxID=2217913 RepID=UPI000DA40278|nr:SMP-30/gluconolactonase/LRE family protein [Burkholderia sp. JP2-270]AWV05654.1 hypothetical protein DM992_41195 [Burkholderia sp. JP2-270]